MKKIVFLFAVMLVLAGCGPRLNDHVVDYRIDLPGSFVETEMEGAAACWYDPADNSSVNLFIVKKASTADAAFKAITADILRETVEETLKESYGELTVTDRFFAKDDVCGLPAYRYCYDVTLGSQSMTQIIVSINADKTYTFTYTTNNERVLAAFEESAKNIQLTIE